jgi:anaerobic dimethyl sulfoxide reductase subunit B (iron-sulfur subunit)
MGIYINQNCCIGCFTCAVSCKDWHDIEAGPVNWIRIKTIEKGEFPNLYLAYLPSMCYHCEDPACIKVCPATAIVKREKDGIVLVDQEKCLGKTECGSLCLKACPWDAPQFGLDKDAKMEKCNLCYDRLAKNQQPICINACPMYALDVDTFENIKKKYGNIQKSEGFNYSEKIKPSVIFTPKLK